MKKNYLFKILTIIFVILSIINYTEAQVLISTNPSDTPDGSAMLQINSSDAGVLIPRLDRTDITTPVEGLLIYDTVDEAFFLYTSAGWINITTNANLWSKDINGIFLNSNVDNVGVGTVGSPGTSKFVIQGETANEDEVLFEVKDNSGETIFRVTSSGVRIYVKDESSSGKAVSGGFAVGRYGTAKDFPDMAYLSVTPYATEVNTEKPVGKAVAGGFAVGRYGTAKDVSTPIFTTSPQETRIYTTETTGGKAVAGGFAVGRYGTAKGPLDNYMHITEENYFIGHSAGAATIPSGIVDGQYNIFFGYESGLKNTTGHINTFLGHNTGYSNLEGNRNVFVGTGSGYSNQYGNYNLFVGFRSGRNNIGIQGDDNSGTRNVFLGYEAGFENTNGSDNVMIGYNAGHENTTGGNNICVGTGSGLNNQINSDNIFIGFQAGYFHVGTGVANEAINNIYIGKGAGRASLDNVGQGNENIFMGTESGFKNTSGERNVFIGYQTGNSNTTGVSNVFLGDHSGFLNEQGINNVFLGYQAGYNNIGDGTTYNGNYNVFIGYQAGLANTDGQSNVFIGEIAGRDLKSGVWNTIIGKEAGMQLDSGKWNTYIGAQSADFKKEGNSNVHVGMASGSYTGHGDENVFLGNKAGHNQGGNYTDQISRNVCVGFETGFLGLGTNNVLLGYKAGRDLTTNVSTGNVFIGFAAGSVETGSNKLYIENSALSTPLIYGEFDNDLLIFNGDVEIANGTSHSKLTFYNATGSYYTAFTTGFQSQDITYTLPSNDGSSGYVLSTNGSGSLSWINGTTAFADNMGDHSATQILDLNGFAIREIGNVLSSGDIYLDNTHWIGTASAGPRLAFNTGDAAILDAEFGLGGITAPAAPLDIKTNSSSQAIRLRAPGLTIAHWNQGVNSGGDLCFFDGTNELVTFENNSGNVGIGNPSTFGGGTNSLVLVEGTDPTSSVTNGVILYADNTNAELKVRDEAFNVTVLSPHNFSLVNKSEPMAWSFYSENHEINQKISVDMLRVIRLVEKLSGEQLVTITDFDDNIIKDNNIEVKALEQKVDDQQNEIEELKKQIQELKELMKK